MDMEILHYELKTAIGKLKRMPDTERYKVYLYHPDDPMKDEKELTEEAHYFTEFNGHGSTAEVWAIIMVPHSKDENCLHAKLIARFVNENGVVEEVTE